MNILFLIIPLAFLLAGGALAAFMYAVRQGQFDDLDTPAHRVLFEDDEPATMV
jgi:cbb3-type cytochrome oxidase maturation protein